MSPWGAGRTGGVCSPRLEEAARLFPVAGREAARYQGCEAEAALLGKYRGELLLGEIGGALGGGIFAAAKPPAAALPRATQDLPHHECFELLRGVMHFAGVARTGSGSCRVGKCGTG